eukprot:6096489-Prymnesium_polylepis.1
MQPNTNDPQCARIVPNDSAVFRRVSTCFSLSSQNVAPPPRAPRLTGRPSSCPTFIMNPMNPHESSSF